MFNLEEERDNLIQKLSEQYSQNIISMEEYERLLEYITKVETKKEISIVEKIIQESGIDNNELAVRQNYEITMPKANDSHLSMFSWRTSNIKPMNGNGGKYVSVFGANRIIVDDLPKGKTIINATSIFGLTEIIVPSKNIKIISKVSPIFSGVFTPNEINKTEEDLPELYIVGKAVFGNITIRTIEEFEQELKQYNELSKKMTEKIHQKIIDKL
jgi:hypothetical protein